MSTAPSDTPRVGNRLSTTGLLTSSELDSARASSDADLARWILRKGLLPERIVEQALAGDSLRLGRYSITGRLGLGGMGVVLRAHDASLGRDVALKVLPQDAEETDIERFRREAKALALLNHPNVVKVYAFEEVEQTFFLVMQLVEGPSLEKRLDRVGRLEEEEVWRLAQHLAQALAHGEEHGLLHRDIKPGNILCEPDDAGTVYKVCDYGLVRQDKGRGTTLTQAGYSLGTPVYMSPEQAKGEELDHRTDMYSLGMTLFQALTGAVPFDGDVPVAVVLTRRLRLEVPDVRDELPEASKEISKLIRALTMRDRRRRPKSWAEVGERITKLRDKRRPGRAVGVPTRARRPKPQAAERPQVETKTFPMGLVVGGVVALSITAGLLLSLVSSDPAPVDPETKTEEKTTAKVERKTSPPAEKTPDRRSAPREPAPWKGTILTEADLARALKAAQRGDPVAQTAAARWLMKKGRRKEAVGWYRRAAKAGHVPAMFDYAQSLDMGFGVKRDRAVALIWYRKSAEAGLPKGMFFYAWALERGYGGRKNMLLATLWYRRAAEAGHPLAKAALNAIAKRQREALKPKPVYGTRWGRKKTAAKSRPEPLPVEPVLVSGWKQAFPKRLEPRKEDGQSLAAEAALGWLARHQAPSGNWDSDDWRRMCRGQRCPRGRWDAGASKWDVGLTSLALLAFFGRGHGALTPEAPQTYRATVRRALRWLLRQQKADGSIKGGGPRMYWKEQTWVYNHALATLALAEAYGLRGEQALERGGRKALDWIVKAQNPNLAWKYGPRTGKNDTSVTAWMTQALYAGKVAGLDVPPEAFGGAAKWFWRVTSSSGEAGYHSPDGMSSELAANRNRFRSLPTMTAAALLGRSFCLAGAKLDRRYRSPSLKTSVNLLLKATPQNTPPKLNYYYWYYGTNAIFHAGRSRSFRKWTKALEKVLLPTQARGGCGNGAWEPVGEWCLAGGRVYATAINALTLETAYRYPKARK